MKLLMPQLSTLLTLINTYVIPPKWAPQPRGPLCFAHAAQSIATPLFIPFRFEMTEP